RAAGVKYATFLRKWYCYRDRGWRGLINRARHPKDRGVGLPQQFVQFWRGILEDHQRDRTGKAAFRQLTMQWRAWRAGDDSLAIPGYELPPPPDVSTGFPRGWSIPNLRRHGLKKYEKALRHQG